MNWLYLACLAYLITQFLVNYQLAVLKDRIKNLEEEE